MNTRRVSWVVGGLIALVGCFLVAAPESPASAADQARERAESGPGQSESSAAGEVRFLDYAAPVPAGWIAEQPASSMRLVQYRVPGTGDEQARFVIYYFGQGQGGSVEANVARWQSQFRGPDGGAVEPVVERFTAHGNAVTLVELMGNYARGVGAGPGEDFKQNQTLLAAVVETPSGSFYPQLHGPSPLVAQQKAAFRAFLRGLRSVAGSQ
jgi:hypothetical protein